FIQNAPTGQFHGQVQTSLTAQVGQDGVGPLLLNDPGDGLGVEGLNVYMIRNVRVSHDGGGVAVDQHYLDPFAFQGTAGLGAGVVKLGGLTNDNGTGTDHQYLFNTGVFRHYS